ncbi:hypothetical protein [Acinetobacter sp. CFCC 10889]|uniref:hypothetical protein n=1 Tax=Acinetobacter sp. CFCC 10889 TaxID=1775557 RepID=UPI000DD0D49E|nr:hypothetical protein [Acinetobacter sp. CFCC 10889]
MKNNLTLPSLEDWGEIPPNDYDLNYTFAKYQGKNIDDAVLMIQQSSQERLFEMQYMPIPVFKYYIFAFKKCLEIGSELGDLNFTFAHQYFVELVYLKMCECPSSIQQIYPQLKPLLYQITHHPQYFDIDSENFKDLLDLYHQLEAKINLL